MGFEKMSQGVEIDIFCGYTSDCDHAGLSIEPDALRVFDSLNIPVEISIIVL